MTTGLIWAIAGISGGARAILLAGYFFISLKFQELRAAERSIQGIVKKEGYRAGDVMRILRQFRSDSDRLKALEQLLSHADRNSANAQVIYTKIKSNVDINALQNTRCIAQARITIISAVFFLALADRGATTGRRPAAQIA